MAPLRVLEKSNSQTAQGRAFKASIEPRGRRSSGGSCSRQSLGLRGWDGLGQTRSKEKQGFVVVVFVGAQEGSR